MRLLVVRPGDLLTEFRAVIPTTVIDTLPGVALRQGVKLGSLLEERHTRGADKVRILFQRANSTRVRRRLPSLRAVDLIYANTAESATVFNFLPDPHPPIITHVHELGFSMDHLLPQDACRNMFQKSNHFVACAEAVRSELIRRGADPNAVTLCPEFIDVNSTASVDDRGEVRVELGIPSNAVVVGGSGSRDWRKGVDLFVRLAWEARRRRPDVLFHFVWVGGSPPPWVNAQLEYDAEQLGVGHVVHFVRPTAWPDRYYAALDMLAMTSREDPYPLVCLEAGLQGVPFVTFESGGAADFARSGPGIVVPYGDIPAMADALASLAVDVDRRQAMGRVAQKRAREHDVALLGPRLVEVIEKTRRR